MDKKNINELAKKIAEVQKIPFEVALKLIEAKSKIKNNKFEENWIFSWNRNFSKSSNMAIWWTFGLRKSTYKRWSLHNSFEFGRINISYEFRNR